MIILENQTNTEAVQTIADTMNALWWTYKSILTSEPMKLSSYKSWYKIYSKFYDLIDHKSESVKLSKNEFVEIKRLLDTELAVLRSGFTEEKFGAIEKVFIKIKQGIDQIIDIISRSESHGF